MYLPKYISESSQKGAEALSMPMANLNAFRAHRTVSWSELARTCLLHEPEMSPENFTGYLRNRIAECSGDIIAAGNTIAMNLPHKPVRIRMNRFLMDMVFDNIVERAVRKNVPCVTFYVNLWEKDDQACLLIGDNRKEPADSWKLRLLRKTIEYHGGKVLAFGQNTKEQNGLYFFLCLPIVNEE